MNRKILAVLFVFCLAGIGSGCGKKDQAQGGTGIPVQKGTVREIIEEIGLLAAVTSVEIRSEISGQVTDVLADVGDRVRKGQVLVYVRGGYEAEEYRIGEVRSPIDGVVIDRNVGPGGRKVEPGDRIRDSLSGFTSGTVLMKVAKLDKMIFEVEINEMDAARIQKGQSCDVKVDALPGRVYRGKLIRVSPVAKQGKQDIRVFKTEVALLETDQDIRPGMTARAQILVNECLDCVKLPLARYFRETCDGKKHAVAYVLDSKAQDKAERRVLNVGASDGQFIGVLEGLEAGEKVIQRPEGRPSPEECAQKSKGWGGKKWQGQKGQG